jgi:hypothetical protein
LSSVAPGACRAISAVKLARHETLLLSFRKKMQSRCFGQGIYSCQ